MDRYNKLIRSIPPLYQATVNPFIKGLLKSWGKGLDDLDIAVDATNKQLFVPTAEGDYLKRLASNAGVVLPTQIGISDPDDRSIIKTMSFNPKQVRQTIYNLLETFYTTAGVYANITSSVSETYALVNEYTIEFLVDNSESVTITFKTSDFQNISAATAFEVANAINKQSLNSRIKSDVYYDYSTDKSYVRVFTLSAGSFGSIAVVGGLAQYVLQFPTVREVGNGISTQWDVAIYSNDITRIEWTGVGTVPDLNPLQINDLLILSGVFNANNIGTFKILDVTIGATVDGVTPGLKYTGTYVEFSNPVAYNETKIQTGNSDVVFYYPYKAQITELPIFATQYETNHKEVVIAIPSTSPIVTRDTLGCTHLHPCLSLKTMEVNNVNNIDFQQFEDINGCDAMYLSGGGTGDFVNGQIITGMTSSQTATVKEVISNAVNDTILAVEGVSGGFIVGEPVKRITIIPPADLFIKLSGVAASTTRGYGIAIDQSTGDFYISGYTNGNLDGEGLTGTYDVFLKKYNSSGVWQWTRLSGVAGKETAGSTVKVAVDISGNIYICGYTLGALNGEVFHGTEDAFVMKYNSAGVRQWTKLTGIAGKSTVANGVTADDAGNVYITGNTGGGIDGQTLHGTQDCFTKKYDTTGTAQWTKLDGVTGNITSGSDIVVEPGTGYIPVDGTTYYFPLDESAPITSVQNLTHTITMNEVGAGTLTPVTTFDFNASGKAIFFPSTHNAYLQAVGQPDLGLQDFYFECDFSLTAPNIWGNEYGLMGGGAGPFGVANWYISFITDIGGSCFIQMVILSATGFQHQMSCTFSAVTDVTRHRLRVEIDRDDNSNCKIYIDGIARAIIGCDLASCAADYIVTPNLFIGTITQNPLLGWWGEISEAKIVYGTYTGSTSLPGGNNSYTLGNSRGNLNGETALGMYDACVIKYNYNGVRQLTNLNGIAGGTKITSGYGITLDSLNNLYIVGNTNGNLDGEIKAGSHDGFLIKYDSVYPTFHKEFTKLTGALGANVYLQGVGVDASGNVFVNGRTDTSIDGQTITGYTDAVYLQYDSTLTKQFTKLNGVTGKNAIGYAAAVEQSTGKVYMAGRTTGALDGILPFVGTEDAYVIKSELGTPGVITATRNFNSLKSTVGATANISSLLKYNALFGLDNLSSQSFQTGEAILGRTVFKTGAVSGSGFVKNETITGTTSHATAAIDDLIFVDRNSTTGKLTNKVGSFIDGEVITGSTSGSTATLSRVETSLAIIESLNDITDFQSGYVYDSLSPYILLDTYSLLTQAITAGSSYDLLQCDIVSSDFPTSGEFIIDYGLSTQEGPVPFYLTPNTTSIRIDPSFVFQYNHAIGSDVRLIKAATSTSITDQYGLDYPVYATGVEEAMLAFQDLVRGLVAAGITIRFIITYPIYRFMDFEFISILVKQYYIPQIQNAPTPEDEYFIYAKWGAVGTGGLILAAPVVIDVTIPAPGSAKYTITGGPTWDTQPAIGNVVTISSVFNVNNTGTFTVTASTTTSITVTNPLAVTESTITTGINDILCGARVVPGDDVGRGYDQLAPTPAGHVGGGKLKGL